MNVSCVLRVQEKEDKNNPKVEGSLGFFFFFLAPVLGSLGTKETVDSLFSCPAEPKELKILRAFEKTEFVTGTVKYVYMDV
jgi:hypothetical protein